MERRRPRSRRPPVNPYHQLGYALAGLGTLLAIGAGVGWMLHRYLDDVDFAMWRAALGVQTSHDLAVETARARHETARRSVSPPPGLTSSGKGNQVWVPITHAMKRDMQDGKKINLPREHCLSLRRAGTSALDMPANCEALLAGRKGIEAKRDARARARVGIIAQKGGKVSETHLKRARQRMGKNFARPTNAAKPRTKAALHNAAERRERLQRLRGRGGRLDDDAA